MTHLFLFPFLGWAMSQPLPHSEIRFCDEKEFAEIETEFMQYRGTRLSPETDPIGYVLECDLSYPPELADYFSQFPPLAEKRVVKKEEYSPHTLALAEKYGVHSTQTPKLLCDLHPKKKYILHYRNLQLCLELGVKLDKIHSAIRFRQSNYLASYISLNTSHRNNSGDDKFKRDFFKLLNSK